MTISCRKVGLKDSEAVIGLAKFLYEDNSYEDLFREFKDILRASMFHLIPARVR